MLTRLGCHRRPSRPPEDGWCSTTAYGIRLPAVCIDWAWPFSILRIRKNACCEEIRGSSGRRRRTSAKATLTMSCFPADTPWTPMATRSTCTTGRRIAPLPWLGPAFARYSNGWMPTEVANAASAPRIDGTLILEGLGSAEQRPAHGGIGSRAARVAMPQSESLHVSYLAQTRKPTPVILRYLLSMQTGPRLLSCSSLCLGRRVVS